jgi:hypothetical protein
MGFAGVEDRGNQKMVIGRMEKAMTAIAEAFGVTKRARVSLSFRGISASSEAQALDRSTITAWHSMNQWAVMIKAWFGEQAMVLAPEVERA